MLKKKHHQAIGIDIQKNVIRYAIKKNGRWLFGEKVTNGSFFKNNKLRNTDQLMAIFQEIAKEVKLNRFELVISAINSKLLIRQVAIQQMETEKEIREYLFFELGESIPLPFEDPIFDLLVYEHTSRKNKRGKQVSQSTKKIKSFTIRRNQLAVNGKVSVVVTSQPILEEVGECVKKSGGQLIGVDYSALAYTRLFQKKINWSQNFILVELDAGTATITIFEKQIPTYVQFDNYNQVNWKYLEKKDGVQVTFPVETESEMLRKLGETIKEMGHYFSQELSLGNAIAQIYLVGGHPWLKGEVQTIIQNENQVPVKVLVSSLKDKDQKRIPERFSLALGLSMKEV